MPSERKPEANPALASPVISIQPIHIQCCSLYREFSGSLWQFPGLVSDGLCPVLLVLGWKSVLGCPLNSSLLLAHSLVRVYLLSWLQISEDYLLQLVERAGV